MDFSKRAPKCSPNDHFVNYGKSTNQTKGVKTMKTIRILLTTLILLVAIGLGPVSKLAAHNETNRSTMAVVDSDNYGNPSPDNYQSWGG
jgi:hypothetical protein